MEAISIAYLLAIGIFLIGLEVLTFSFIFFFIGLGFIIVAGISSIFIFSNGTVQIAIAFVLALFLALILRKTLLEKISKESTQKEEKIHKSGIGIVENGAIKFEGTYWETFSNLSKYKDGDRVNIIDILDNRVILEDF